MQSKQAYGRDSYLIYKYTYIYIYIYMYIYIFGFGLSSSVLSNVLRSSTRRFLKVWVCRVGFVALREAKPRVGAEI